MPLTFTEEDAAFLTHINGQLTDSVTMLSHQVAFGEGRGAPATVLASRFLTSCFAASSLVPFPPFFI